MQPLPRLPLHINVDFVISDGIVAHSLQLIHPFPPTHVLNRSNSSTHTHTHTHTHVCTFAMVILHPEVILSHILHKKIIKKMHLVLSGAVGG